jgi:preprotein translocase subunit Sec61beta
MPNSGSGLTMFFDEDSSALKINPKTAILAMAVITVLVAIAQGVA